ncbi:hypothetical protein TBLA_0H02390 [Henningerozyma blattae CBS 6284]|uniref:Cargo-transport protein YPP1 n=1 Tax=Henningerozyma blattae (strain ATCC 34711 / CBS 6284 / DSM 70876 / NBRC 10599 / NRRL Y-10934 / UCD 77-7) TaxID=1071380 RepID=I2H822_HENB6|nr:hypothetical protein TBLA_0H02390 [Tetrapisispora blattae CBS 6284]CCH62524.1 hypothetical protein TBLA_0H02390 [Tetrapisispora blattae CBS 6284]
MYIFIRIFLLFFLKFRCTHIEYIPIVMPTINETIPLALSSSLLGSGIFDSGSKLLDEALSLNFRVNYHLFDSNKSSLNNSSNDSPDTNSTIGKVLYQDVVTALGKSNNKSDALHLLIQKLLFNLKAILSFHNDSSSNIKPILQQSFDIQIKHSTKFFKEFTQFLNLQNLYYQSSHDPILNQIFTILNNEIPLQSNGLTFHYLNLILKKKLPSNLHNWKNLVAVIDKKYHSSPLLCFIALQLEPKRHANDSYYIEISNTIISNSKFPKANDTNNKHLQQFHIFLSHYFIKYNTFEFSHWKKFIIESMTKTFQSLLIAKTGMIFFAKLNYDDNKDASFTESLANYNNFKRLNIKNYELNGEIYSDIISIIQSVTFILQFAISKDSNFNNKIPINSKNFSNNQALDLKETSASLLKLLSHFYKINNLKLITNLETDKDLNENWLSNSFKLSSIPNHIKSILIDSWMILFKLNSNDLDSLLQNNLNSYLCNSMALFNSTQSTTIIQKPLQDIQFDYCLTLAKQRNITKSISFLKKNILLKNPNFFKGWHLLALLESSVNEDLNVSLKIISSVIETMTNMFLIEKTSVFKITDRWQLIQLKLTQILLIEDLFGLSDSLEMLTELFELFSVVFPKSKSKSNYNLGKAHSQSIEFLTQYIWVFAANMYMRNINSKDTDNKSIIKNINDSIAEAEKVKSSFKNLNIDLTNSYYLILDDNTKTISTSQWKKAINAFEDILYYDNLNIDAIIGLSEIILPNDEDNDQIQYQLQNNYFNLSSKTEKPNKLKNRNIFSDEKDKSAFIARVKFLLEYAIKNSQEAYYSPEIWWYISKIYEKYQDYRFKDSLLNCIKFKESEPIRDFKYCDF